MRRAAPEPNKRALYVGGLDQRVTEDILRQIFETAGHVVSVKIIPDKNVGDLQVPSVGTVSFFSPVAMCTVMAVRRGYPKLRPHTGLQTQ